MPGENGAQIQISEERKYYFHSLVVCRVILNLKKSDFGEGKKSPVYRSEELLFDMWAIILPQQMNNLAVRAPNISLERRLEKPERGVKTYVPCFVQQTQMIGQVDSNGPA